MFVGDEQVSDSGGEGGIRTLDTRLADSGGEGGIRTLDTRLTYTPLAGERLQPLGHFSGSAKPTTKTSAKKRRFTLRHEKNLKFHRRQEIPAFQSALVGAQQHPLGHRHQFGPGAP